MYVADTPFYYARSKSFKISRGTKLEEPQGFGWEKGEKYEILCHLVSLGFLVVFGNAQTMHSSDGEIRQIKVRESRRDNSDQSKLSE